MSDIVRHNTKLSPIGLPGRRSNISAEKPKNSRQVMIRLWKYLSRQKPMLLLIAVLLLINTGSTLAGSYLLRPIINKYIIPGNIRGLMHMIFLLLIIYLSGFLAGFFLNRLMIVVSQKTVQVIRGELFSKLQSLPLRFFDSNSHGDLMSRFTNDIDNISDTLNTSVTQLFTSTITLIGIFLLMLYISPLLTLLKLFIFSLMLFVASRIIKKSKNYFTSQQTELGILNGYVEEMINGQKVVKVFCYESNAAKDFENINYELRDKATQAQLYSGIMMPVIQNLNTINFALTATVGGMLAILRGLDLGGLAAFLQYSRQFGRPVNEISSQYNSLQSALAGAERIFQILDEVPEIPDAPDAIALTHVKGDIQFSNVMFGYDADKIVLKDISLHALPGTKIAFVGASGAGKTTIISLLPRFYDIQSGTITIDHRDIGEIKRDS